MKENIRKIINYSILIIIPFLLFILIVKIPMPANTVEFFSLDNRNPIFLLPTAFFLYICFKRKGHIGNVYTLTLIVVLYALGLAWNWNSGLTNTSQLAGSFPTSDASGYYTQAYSALTTGGISGDAGYRPLSHILSASLLSISNLNSTTVILIYVFLNAISSYLAANEIKSTHGPFAATIFIITGFFFAKFRLTNFMTEQLGFLLGNLAIAFLWNGISNKRIQTIALGVFTLSFGLVVRPAAMFILPMVILWVGFYFKKDKKKYSFRISLLILLVAIIPFFLNSLYSNLYNRSDKPLFSNFGYTFYGLATGNMGWSQFITDHPEKAANEAYRITLQKIYSDPKSLLIGIYRAYNDYTNPQVINAYSFLHLRKPIYYRPVFIIAIINLIVILITYKKSKYSSFMFFCLVGIFLSVPFAPTRDVGYRSYTVTNPFLQVLLIFSIPCLCKWINTEVSRVQKNILKQNDDKLHLTSPELNNYDSQKQKHILVIGEIILLAIICLTFLFPLLLFPKHQISYESKSLNCKDDEVPIGFWTNHDSWIHLVPEDSISNGIQIPFITKTNLEEEIEGYAYHKNKGYGLIIEVSNVGNSFSWIPYNYYDPTNEQKTSRNILIVNTNSLPSKAGFLQICGIKSTFDQENSITEYLILASNLNNSNENQELETIITPQFSNFVYSGILIILNIVMIENFYHYYKIRK